MTENERAYKSRNLRYKKAILSGLNYDDVLDELYDINEECDNVRYYFETDEETLLNALDGDEEEEYEFKMLFSDLSANCEQLLEAVRSSEIVKNNFDDFFVRMADGSKNFRMVGYDSYEEDYFGLVGYETEWAQKESGKRLMRLTKEELLNTAGKCFNVLVGFLDIRYKYDYLKSAFDILKSENTAFLSAIKDIEAAYIKADESGWNYYADAVKKYDKMVSALPDRVWLE